MNGIVWVTAPASQDSGRKHGKSEESEELVERHGGKYSAETGDLKNDTGELNWQRLKLELSWGLEEWAKLRLTL